ncbi:MAG TPA: hypothetical protein PKD85_03020 [Saprospiraceae bacterium]|nr:hypothetical protein [Saprospiraceae bacterium]
MANINKQRDLWTYANKDAPLGGLEDRYIRINGNCHPDFVSVPIGDVNGAQLCVRKPPQCDGETQEDLLRARGQNLIDRSQGYHRGVLNLYDVKPQVPTQQVNPQYYSDRRIPYEADLVRRDILRRPLKYSGTGINPLRTPHQLQDAKHRYWEYAYTYTPVEDSITGMRVADKLDETEPVPKYDITKLHQAYPIWKNESAYIHNPQNKLDTTYFDRIV